jgi:hypothetical protein
MICADTSIGDRSITSLCMPSVTTVSATSAAKALADSMSTSVGGVSVTTSSTPRRSVLLSSGSHNRPSPRCADTVVNARPASVPAIGAGSGLASPTSVSRTRTDCR